MANYHPFFVKESFSCLAARLLAIFVVPQWQWPHRTLLYKNKTNVVTSLLYANKIRKAQCVKKSLKGFGNSKKCVIQSEYF